MNLMQDFRLNFVLFSSLAKNDESGAMELPKAFAIVRIVKILNTFQYRFIIPNVKFKNCIAAPKLKSTI